MFPRGFSLKPMSGKIKRLDFFELEWFFYMQQAPSDVDSLCNDFVYAVQIPGLSSGCGDKIIYLEVMTS